MGTIHRLKFLAGGIYDIGSCVLQFSPGLLELLILVNVAYNIYLSFYFCALMNGSCDILGASGGYNPPLKMSGSDHSS